MKQLAKESEATKVAAAIDSEIRSLPVRNTPNMRAVRRKYSQALKDAPAEFVFRLAMMLCKVDDYRWLAYELIRSHRAAFEQLGPTELENLGKGINSWWTVDDFARTLSEPAWLHRQIPDQLLLKWALSSDHWW
jgi:hypothetical protein